MGHERLAPRVGGAGKRSQAAKTPLLSPSESSAPTATSCVRPAYVPSNDEVKSELWRIATGDGSDASRVAALRILADVLGLMKPESSEIPEAMNTLLDALSVGMAQRANGIPSDKQ